MTSASAEVKAKYPQHLEYFTDKLPSDRHGLMVAIQELEVSQQARLNYGAMLSC